MRLLLALVLAATQQPAPDSVLLLAPARLARLGDAGAWRSYVERSRRMHARDTASMGVELRALGRDTMMQAPYARAFDVTSAMTAAWFAGDSARRIGESILSFQAPNGGWSKHVEFATGTRARGQSYFGESNAWGWISTFDNNSTTSELQFLRRLNAAHADRRYRDAILRGIEYVLAAQMPNGCWPQNFPLDGGYHDAVTFNDGAMVNILTLLDDVARGAFPVRGDRRAVARAASRRGLACILRAQVVVDGVRTVWGQQHDPLTLAPTSARTYELTALTSSESAGIVRYLMRLPTPHADVVRAVRAAADWFKRSALRDSVYQDFELRAQPGAGPLWARLSEIGTNRPIFANRDGVKLYDFDRLTDRRRGYGWFTTEPANVLAEYERWAVKNKRQ